MLMAGPAVNRPCCSGRQSFLQGPFHMSETRRLPPIMEGLLKATLDGKLTQNACRPPEIGFGTKEKEKNREWPRETAQKLTFLL